MAFSSNNNDTVWRTDYAGGQSPLRFFLFSSRPHWKAAILATVLSATAAALSASVSYVFKLITNAVIVVKNGGSYHDLIVSCAAAILLLAVAKVCWRLGGFAGARWATGASATGRYALLSYVTLHSH